MGRRESVPREEVTFLCPNKHRFEAAPDRVEEVPDRDWHPWEYFARCPECGEDAGWAHWERALAKAWAHATGPRTTEGKAKAAANLQNQSSESRMRTRFNALKHGLYARTATYFPARPGRYPHCDGCQYLDGCAERVACQKRAELFLRYQIAFETRDPGLLGDLQADTQAAVQALINDMILAIAQDGGPRIRELQWYYDKDGACHLAEWVDEQGQTHQIHEIKAHPLLKPLIEFLHKNSMSLADMEMTPRAQDESEVMRGYLETRRQDGESLEEFRRKQAEGLDLLRGLIGRSQARGGEPVVIDGEVEDG